ncbi:hypothetical protein BDZ91DRAFT_839460 [Kalaharituber pfeilii]|nr:hypothetical protein BDZ91DRAFT_839460 [Kalaharituber pfeilii]
MSSGLSIENFLQQWEVPSITGYTFDAADRIFSVGRISRGTGRALLHITYLQKGGIPLQYSAAQDFTMVKKLKEKKCMHRRDVLKSAASYYLKPLPVPYPATGTGSLKPLLLLQIGYTIWKIILFLLVVNATDNIVVYDIMIDTHEIELLAGWVDNIAAKAIEVGKSVRRMNSRIHFDYREWESRVKEEVYMMEEGSNIAALTGLRLSISPCSYSHTLSRAGGLCYQGICSSEFGGSGRFRVTTFKRGVPEGSRVQKVSRVQKARSVNGSRPDGSID